MNPEKKLVENGRKQKRVRPQFFRRLIKGETRTENLKRRREEEIKKISEIFLHRKYTSEKLSLAEATTLAHSWEGMITNSKSGFRKMIDSFVESGKFPSTIISEDAAGRVSSSVLKLVIESLHKKYFPNEPYHLAVVSYPVGTNPHAIKRSPFDWLLQKRKNKEIAKRVTSILFKRSKEMRDVIFITDAVGTGSSLNNFLRQYRKTFKENAPRIFICYYLDIRNEDYGYLNKGSDDISVSEPHILLQTYGANELVPFVRLNNDSKGRKLLPIESREERKERIEFEKKVSENLVKVYLEARKEEEEQK